MKNSHTVTIKGTFSFEVHQMEIGSKKHAIECTIADLRRTIAAQNNGRELTINFNWDKSNIETA